MPIQVPVSQQVELAPLRLPSAPTLGDGGTGALAKGLGQATDLLAEAQLRLQRERDTTRVFEASAQFGDVLRQQNEAWRGRKGSAAFGIQDDAVQWWEKEPSKISVELENDQQRTMFDRFVAQQRDANLDSLSTYESGERHVARNQAADAAITNQVSLAAQNYDSPSAVSAARDQVVEKVAVQAYFNGWDKNVTEAKKREALTRLHVSVFENMVERSPETARKYLDATKGEIDGTVWDNLDKTAKTGTELAAAQTLADDIWNRGLRGTAAYDAARKEADGEKRERALLLLRTRDQERDEAKAEATQNVVDRAWAKFTTGGMAALNARDLSDLSRLSPTTLETMRARGWTPQDQVNTDWSTYQELTDMARDNPGAFANPRTTDLRKYSGKLNSRELDALTKLQTATAQQLKTNAPKPVATTQQLLEEAHATMGWSTKDAEKKGLLDRRVREAIGSEEQATGKELTNEAQRKIIDRLLMSGAVPRNWWLDRGTQFFEVIGTPEEAAFRFEVPDAERGKIEAALKSRNIKVDEETVQKYYRAFIDWQQAQP